MIIMVALVVISCHFEFIIKYALYTDAFDCININGIL